MFPICSSLVRWNTLARGVTWKRGVLPSFWRAEELQKQSLVGCVGGSSPQGVLQYVVTMGRRSAQGITPKSSAPKWHGHWLKTSRKSSEIMDQWLLKNSGGILGVCCLYTNVQICTQNCQQRQTSSVILCPAKRSLKKKVYYGEEHNRTNF